MMVDGMTVIGAGLALGIGAALLMVGMISRLLCGIQPTDPIAFAASAMALAAVAFVACLAPAARATRIAPASALRKE